MEKIRLSIERNKNNALKNSKNILSYVKAELSAYFICKLNESGLYSEGMTNMEIKYALEEYLILKDILVNGYCKLVVRIGKNKLEEMREKLIRSTETIKSLENEKLNSEKSCKDLEEAKSWLLETKNKE